MPEILSLDNLSSIDNLELLAKQVVEGFIIGLHKSPFHGFSVEFAEHRLYNPGEPIRNIDWKVYARNDRMYVKKFEEETNLRCQLVVDASSSMYFPDDSVNKVPHNKITFAVICTASIMHLLKKQRDSFGLSVFSDKLDINLGARGTAVHHKLLLSHLQNLLANEKKNSNTAAATSLHQIAESIHKRSLVVVFSDMIDSAFSNSNEENNIFSALQHLKHNKHEVIVFHIIDKKKEEDFEFENRPYQFVDLETREKLKLHPNEVKEFYTEKMTAFKKQLLMKCAQYRIDLVEADVNKNFSQVLLPYLVKRTKMM